MTRRNRPHLLTRLLFFYAGLAIANLASAWLSGDVSEAAGPCFWQGIGFGAYGGCRSAATGGRRNRVTGRERLLLVASLLWGKQGKAGLQEELRVNRRTLHRYLNGLREVNPHLLLELDAAMLLRIGKMGAALDATVALLEPDGSLLTYTADGAPSLRALPPDLRNRLRLVLEEVKAHRENQETSDAPE